MKCPFCIWSNFECEDQLREHILSNHKNESSDHVRYQCSCGKLYSLYSSLLKHQQTCFGKEGVINPTANPTDATDPDLVEAMCVDDAVDDAVDKGTSSSSFDNMDFMDLNDTLPGEQLSDPIESPEVLLQEEAINFLIYMKEKCNTTQKTINEIIKGMDKLNKRFLQVLEKLFVDLAGVAEVLSVTELLSILHNLENLSLFQGINTKGEIERYLIDEAGVQMPEKVVFKTQQSIKNGKLVSVDVDFGYYVPLLPHLERFLSHKDVLHCVDHPREPEPWTYSTVLDGYIYQNHPVYKKDKKALALMLYHDGLEVVDLTSSRVMKYNMTNFYWSLGNIYPEFRSTDRSINLYASVKTEHLKKYGYDKILKDFIDGINKLSEGVLMNINEKRRTFYGLLLCTCGDTPAQASLGNFKGSVAAKKPCRNCLASKATYLKITDVSTFVMRDLASHRRHVAEVEEYKNLTNQEKRARGSDPSVEYGVNGESALDQVVGLDVTTSLVQDGMHVVNEGPLEYVCRLTLINVVKDNKSLSVEEVNNSISKYNKFLTHDKPNLIQDDQLQVQRTLRQSAAQIRNLALFLPFALRVKGEDGSLKFAGDMKYLDCFLCLLKVVNLCNAYKYHITDANRLKTLIRDFHEKLLVLDPEPTMAKIHMLHHLPPLIVLFGVIRQLSCFRYEAHHAFFKRLLKILHNYVNPIQSLSERHQTRQVHSLMQENFLYHGHEFRIPNDTSGLVNQDTNLVRSIFTSASRIYQISFLKVHGTIFADGSVVLLSERPKFGIIRRMYAVDEDFAFVCQELAVGMEDPHLYGIEVTPTSSRVVIDVKKLIFPHKIIRLISEGKMYVIPQGHRNILT